jgi:hypothetical protein
MEEAVRAGEWLKEGSMRNMSNRSNPKPEPTPAVTSDKNYPDFIEGNDCKLAKDFIKATSSLLTNKVGGYVQGWPLLAKEQSIYVNGSLHRRFDWGRQLILNYKEGKIEQMQKKLMALHREEEAKDPGSLRSLTPWQLGVEAEEGELSSQRDKLMQEFGPLVYDYCECRPLRHVTRQLTQLPPPRSPNASSGHRDTSSSRTPVRGREPPTPH